MSTPVIFDLTIFDADGVPWFGTVDGSGEITESDFQTPDPTLAHDRPYLLPPENFSATEIDFLAGSSRIGAVSVGVLDTRLTATDQTTGQVTSRIKEAVGSQAIMRRWDGAAWVRIWDGVVQSYSVDSEVLLLYWFHLYDARERERAQPLFYSNFVLFGADAATGPAIDYGALPGGGYLLDAVAPFESIVSPGISHFQAFAATDGVSFGNAPLPQDFFVDLQDRGLPVQDIDGLYYYRDVQVRWRAKGTADPWVTLRDMPSISASPVVTYPRMGLGPTLQEYFTTPTLYFGSFDAADIPATGQEIEFQILAATITEDAPFFWDGGSKGDLLREIYDGDHSAPGARPVPYNVAGMAAFAAATDSGRTIIDAPVADAKKWVEANIYQATGYAPGLDVEQKIYPVSGALPANTATVPAIAANSLHPPGEWTHDLENVVNTVEYTYLREGVADQETTQQKGGRRYLFFGPRNTTSVEGTLSQWDRYFTTPVSPPTISNAASVAAFGVNKLTLAPVTVRSIGDVDGRPISGDTSDEAGAQLAQKVGRQVTLRYARGAPVLTIDANASDPVVAALKIGDYVRIGAHWFPDYNSGERRFGGYMQVLAVSDPDPATRRLTLVDCGVPDVAAGADAACLSGGAATFLPDGSAARVYVADGSLVNACAYDVTLPRVLLIATGGNGGTGGADNTPGGGGAGGVLEATDVLIAAGATIPITIGAVGVGGGASGGDTVLWAAANGTALIPGVDTPLPTLRALGGGGGGNADGAGQAGGSGGGGGETLPISGGSNSPGGPGTAGQGFAGGDGNSAGGLSTCQEAAGGGGGSYGGSGGSGNSGVGGGAGGPITFLPAWGVPAGSGGSGPWKQAAGGSGGLCSIGFAPGVTGTGYGAGGGGGGGSGLSGILVVSYEGAAPALAPPTVTSTTLEADGRVTVCVEAADWPVIALEDYRVRVDYATGAVEPAATSGDWRLAGYLEAPGCVTTPPVPTGAKVWSRATAEAAAFLPSEPTTPEDTDTPETPGLLAYELTIDADGVATVTWEPNAFAGIVRIRGLIHDDTGDVDRPLAFLQDVLSSVGTYTLPGVVAQGEFYTLDLEAWSDAVPPTGNAALMIDQFTRGDNSTVGGTWVQHGNGWSITSNRLRNDGANSGAYVESQAAAVGESFIEAVVQTNVINQGHPQIVARGKWLSGTSFDGYVLTGDGSLLVWRIDKVSAGVFTSIDTTADATLTSAVDYTTQLYVADGVQEGWGNGVSVNAADTTFDAVDDGKAAVRKQRLSGNVVALTDDYVWMSTKYVTVRDLPAGWKAKVLGAADAILATATAVAGVARVDCSRYGGATRAVTPAGFSAVIVTDAADVEQARYDAAAIYPGLDGTYVGNTISGVSGIGTIYRASEQQPAMTAVADAVSLQGWPISTVDPTEGQALVLTAGVYVPTDVVTGPELAAWPGSANLTTIGTLIAGEVPAERVTGGTFGAGDFQFAYGVLGIGAAPDPAFGVLVVREGGISNTRSRAHSDLATDSAGFNGQRSRGTIAAPTAVLAEDALVINSFGGYTGAVWYNGARMVVRAAENWSSGARGTKIVFDITPIGDNSTDETVIFHGDGTLQVNGVLMRGITIPFPMSNTTPGTTTSPLLQSTGANAGFIRTGASASAFLLSLNKTRGTLTGARVALNSGDAIAQINFSGDDGVDLGTQGVKMVATVTGAVSANRLPTRYGIFTAEGAADNDIAEKFVVGPAGALSMVAGQKFYFDGVAATGDTHISESPANTLVFTAGNIAGLTLSSSSVAALLSAGTTARAPLGFTSGPLTTGTLVAGRVEFLTDDLSLVITTGLARKGVVLDDGARLTSGRTPKATTNGRLIDGPAPVASGGALAAYATGPFGLDSDVNMAALHALVSTIRSALVANGTLS